MPRAVSVPDRNEGLLPAHLLGPTPAEMMYGPWKAHRLPANVVAIPAIARIQRETHDRVQAHGLEKGFRIGLCDAPARNAAGLELAEDPILDVRGAFRETHRLVRATDAIEFLQGPAIARQRSSVLVRQSPVDEVDATRLEGARRVIAGQDARRNRFDELPLTRSESARGAIVPGLGCGQGPGHRGVDPESPRPCQSPCQSAHERARKKVASRHAAALLAHLRPLPDVCDARDSAWLLDRRSQRS